MVKFRFLEYPDSLNQGAKQFYFVTVSVDPGLYTVASRLGAQLYGETQVQEVKQDLESRRAEQTLVDVAKTLSPKAEYDVQDQMILTSAEAYEERKAWVMALERQPLNSHQVIAVASDFGTATLLSVRDTFKSPLYVALYTIFVLAACFSRL